MRIIKIEAKKLNFISGLVQGLFNGSVKTALSSDCYMSIKLYCSDSEKRTIFETLHSFERSGVKS